MSVNFVTSDIGVTSHGPHDAWITGKRTGLKGLLRRKAFPHQHFIMCLANVAFSWNCISPSKSALCCHRQAALFLIVPQEPRHSCNYNKSYEICTGFCCNYNDIIEWIHLPRYWHFVRGIHWSPVVFPKKSVTRGFNVFFDLRLNKRFSQQLGRMWFGVPTGSLWRHCNVIIFVLGGTVWSAFPYP